MQKQNIENILVTDIIAQIKQYDMSGWSGKTDAFLKREFGARLKAVDPSLNAQTFILEQQKYFDLLMRAIGDLTNAKIFMLLLRLLRLVQIDISQLPATPCVRLATVAEPGDKHEREPTPINTDSVNQMRVELAGLRENLQVLKQDLGRSRRFDTNHIVDQIHTLKDMALQARLSQTQKFSARQSHMVQEEADALRTRVDELEQENLELSARLQRQSRDAFRVKKLEVQVQQLEEELQQSVEEGNALRAAAESLKKRSHVKPPRPQECQRCKERELEKNDDVNMFKDVSQRLEAKDRQLCAVRRELETTQAQLEKFEAQLSQQAHQYTQISIQITDQHNDLEKLTGSLQSLVALSTQYYNQAQQRQRLAKQKLQKPQKPQSKVVSTEFQNAIQQQIAGLLEIIVGEQVSHTKLLQQHMDDLISPLNTQIRALGNQNQNKVVNELNNQLLLVQAELDQTKADYAAARLKLQQNGGGASLRKLQQCKQLLSQNEEEWRDLRLEYGFLQELQQLMRE